MDGHSLWAEEPADIPRLTEDVPNRSKRMKTLGNAVSPPQVFPICKPRTSVRKQLSETKQAASPKRAAARSKQHEMEV